MLTGTALAAGRPEQREQAERLLDFTLDGLSTGSLPGNCEGAAAR
jgi:hypothetical protein